MKKAAKLIVQGTVQGVFYRQFVKEHAEKLKLRGFVRNTPKGEVEVVVEGHPEDIGRLVGLLKEGPQHSQIRDVLIEEKKWSGDYSEFKILRF
jgi:acylphosphatase